MKGNLFHKSLPFVQKQQSDISERISLIPDEGEIEVKTDSTFRVGNPTQHITSRNTTIIHQRLPSLPTIIHSKDLLTIQGVIFVNIRHFLSNSKISIKRFQVVLGLIEAIPIVYMGYITMQENSSFIKVTKHLENMEILGGDNQINFPILKQRIVVHFMDGNSLEERIVR